MSTFRRRGHYRKGPNGQQVWVSSHNVTRSDGGKYSYSPSFRPKPKISTYNSSIPPATLPRSNRWAEPNATCPVCGAAVYFYKNEAGSRVYFDEMGPPWPKHPCLVSLFFTQPLPELRGPRQTPKLREPSAGRPKTASNKPILGDGPQTGIGGAYRAFSVREFDAGKIRTVLHLAPVSDPKVVRLLDVEGRISPEPEQLVFVSKTAISYFDVSQMLVVERPAGLIPDVLKEKSPNALSNRQTDLGCGWAAVLFSLSILLWLIFGLWGAEDQSFWSVVGGLALTVTTAFGLLLGFSLISAEKDVGNDKRS